MAYNRGPVAKSHSNHNCVCTIVAKESSAMLSNIVLDATLDLSVLETLRINVPMKTECNVTGIVRPPPVEEKPRPKTPPPAAKVAYVGERYEFKIEVDNLYSSKADPYFMFYLGDRFFYGGRDTALTDSKNAVWSFPVNGSDVKLLEMEGGSITLRWMDYEGSDYSNDFEVGETVIKAYDAIRNIKSGTSKFMVNSGLLIKKTSKSANIPTSMTRVKMTVTVLADPRKTLNRTGSIRNAK